jgi:thiol:disulfide interchange protein DsbD
MNRFLAVLLVSMLSLPPALAQNDDEEPLLPDEAFKLQTSTIDSNTIRAEWIIAEGYYLYRGKFKFTSDTPGVTLGDPSFPPGKVKEDEFFGKVETYRHQVAVDIPVKRSDPAIKSINLTTISQGCADIGICYPPQTKTVKLDLPASTSSDTTPSGQTSSTFDALKKLGSSLGLVDAEDKFLQPDEAFVFSTEVIDGNTIRARWDISEGYYLYRDKFKFELEKPTDGSSSGVSLGQINFPRGEEKVDESFGKMEVFHNVVVTDIPLLRSKLTPTEINLVTKYQGCAEAGFCYPPQTKKVSLSLPKGMATPVTATASTDGTALSAAEPEQFFSEQDEIAASLKKGGILTVLSFFGFGLLLAFTPCVFPMIPILSSIIVGQGEKITTGKAFTMSLVYVLAMAVTYTAAGVIAGMFGENLQATFQNPWILSVFAAVFVLLSLSMFGFYDLQMPNAIQSKLTEFSNRQAGGTLAGVGIMGFLSALIVGPCVAAPLAGALIYIGQTGDPYLGGIALFSLSLGMGAPLLAIGTSAGKILPRAGDWMESIKAVFGVLLLAVAIWMLERIIPEQIIMLLWAALFIVSAIYMGALEPYGAGATGWRKLWKGTGLIMLVYGILLVVGAASGAKDYMMPLERLAAGPGGANPQAMAAAQTHLEFKQIKSIQDLDRELAAARSQGKPVMLDFYADWCVSCKEMEKYTFSDTGVQQALSNAVLLQADVTDNNATDKALMKRFGIIGPPSILFFDANGKERRKYRLVGFLKPIEFRDHTEKALQPI